MIELPYTTEDGTNYTIQVDYTYTHKPAELKADPNDSCADESELDMKIKDIIPLYKRYSWVAETYYEDEIRKSWNGGPLYDKAAEMEERSQENEG